jgi:hypothetical protein
MQISLNFTTLRGQTSKSPEWIPILKGRVTMDIRIIRTGDTILMIRPIDFGYNEETGTDIEFQQNPVENQLKLNQQAN